MAFLSMRGVNIRAISTCVPSELYDNLDNSSAFPAEDVQKIVRMAGVRERYLADESVCSSDLCESAALDVMAGLHWPPESIDALIVITQSPDYLLPSTSCILQHKLGLPTTCLAFDIGLGCSGYPYGLMVVSSLMQGKGVKRALLLHGETPSRFAHPEDRTVALLFSDAGSATAIEAGEDERNKDWHFCLHTDGGGYESLIIKGGGFRNRFPDNRLDHYVHMDGATIFNFTIKRMPALIEETLTGSGKSVDDIDYCILHQSNQFIMRHLINKVGISPDKVPFTIGTFGSAGGPSVPLTITNGKLKRPSDRPLSLLVVGYGVGLSWGAAIIDLPAGAVLNHAKLEGVGDEG